MADHVLMTYATRLPHHNAPTMPPNSRYDVTRGYWVIGNTPLIATDNFLEGGLYTKKRHQETGEDQKHE